MNIVITGANRGIGLELARQYLARGDNVYAGVRNPANTGELSALQATSAGELVINACDVAQTASVKAFAATLTVPVDILINNAGVRIKPDGLAEVAFGGPTQTFQINTLGPLRMTAALLPLLRRAKGAKIINFSSDMASLTNNITGGSYGYRMSKAALNMATRSLAHDLKPEGILAVVISPGWVKTDMGGPSATTPVADSALSLIQVIAKLTFADSGNYFDFQGGHLAW